VGSPKRCTEAIRTGRRAKANQFYLAAEAIAATIEDQDIADAYVTLCVHAGIAAADVICCARLGEYAQGDDHQEAVTLLSKAARANADLAVEAGWRRLPGRSSSSPSSRRGLRRHRRLQHRPRPCRPADP
jgi:hypothetical protein